MDKIIIKELEVFYRVGVPAAERAKPQRLLVSVEMEMDFTTARKSDSIKQTINYYEVALRLEKFGQRRSWNLLESLAVEIAEMILCNYKPKRVTVEIQKFILPETRYVGVQVTRPG